MTLAALFDEFARRNAMAAPRADGDRRFRVVADDDVEVTCFERFGQFCLVSELGSPPEDRAAQAEWLRRLLNDAFKRMKRSRTTPALDEDGAAVVFTRTALAGLAVQDLETLIEEHLNTHEALRRTVSGATDRRVRGPRRGSRRRSCGLEPPGVPVAGGARRAVEALAELVKEVTYTLALAMPRTVGAMTALSFLGPNVLGGALARNGVAAALSLLVYPVVLVQVEEAQLSSLVFAAAAAKEFLVGMLIGTVAMVVFWCVQAVGNFIDNQRGATMASSMDPMVGEQSSPFGLFLTQSMVAVFFCTGVFNTFLGGIYESYAMWPATSFWPVLDGHVLRFVIAQFALIAKIAVLVGGPVVIAMFLAELGLGFISRFAPQLNVFFLAMPVKSGVACLMLVLFWGVLVVFFGDMLRDLDTPGTFEVLFG